MFVEKLFLLEGFGAFDFIFHGHEKHDKQGNGEIPADFGRK